MAAGRASVALLMLGAVACSAPARHLPARVVDDPITLPRRMVQVSAVGSAPLLTGEDQIHWRQAAPTWARGAELVPSIAYGITDRVTLVSLLGVRVALLDDAPTAYAATGRCAAYAPVGVAITAGVHVRDGSSFDSKIVVYEPRLAVQVRKHLGARLLLDGTAGWGTSGGASESASAFGSYSWFHLGGGVVLQVTRELAVQVYVHDALMLDDRMTYSFWWRHSLAGAPGVLFRPRHWVTLGLQAELALAERAILVVPTPRPEGPSVYPETARGDVWGQVTAQVHW